MNERIERATHRREKEVKELLSRERRDDKTVVGENKEHIQQCKVEGRETQRNERRVRGTLMKTEELKDSKFREQKDAKLLEGLSEGSVHQSGYDGQCS